MGRSIVCMRTFVSSLLFLFALTQLAHAEGGEATQWEQIDNDDGIRVWKHEVPGLDLPGFRGEAVIDASMAAIERAIQDAAHHTEWMYRCAESKIIQQVGADQTLLYNRTQSPWPVWDRDVVLETRAARASDGSSVVLSFHAAENAAYPRRDKVVRMPHLLGFYKLVRLGDKQTKVTYQVEADPGGSLPRWLAARIARDMPYETLSRLRKRVTSKKS
ncbi:MAG: Collagenase [Myxococcaceae bacterium]|nr:Collagenase [Myxococcaceae bacterium]